VLPSLSLVKPEAVQSICTSLGQILLGYFAAAFGSYFLAVQLVSQKGVSYDNKIRGLSSTYQGTPIDLIGRLKTWIESEPRAIGTIPRDRIKEIANDLSEASKSENQMALISQRNITHNIQNIENDLDEVKHTLIKIKGLFDTVGTNPYTLDTQQEKNATEYNQLFLQLHNSYSTIYYRLSLERLQFLRLNLDHYFILLSASCFAHAFLCFWPDVMLYKSLPSWLIFHNHREITDIPSGVPLLFVLMVFIVLFLTTAIFIKAFVDILYQSEEINYQ
jgi:hypothetical protein